MCQLASHEQGAASKQARALQPAHWRSRAASRTRRAAPAFFIYLRSTRTQACQHNKPHAPASTYAAEHTHLNVVASITAV
jgi:hypothetical protein